MLQGLWLVSGAVTVIGNRLSGRIVYMGVRRFMVGEERRARRQTYPASWSDQGASVFAGCEPLSQATLMVT